MQHTDLRRLHSAAVVALWFLTIATPSHAAPRTNPVRVASGQYLGLGLVPQSVTGAGFRPDFVIIKSDGAAPAVIRTATMPAGQSKQIAMSTSLVANDITSLDADGFTVSTAADVNSLGTMYYWFAFAGLPSDAAVGSYTGNGVDDRFVDVGLVPSYVAVWSAGAQAGVQRFAGQSGDVSLRFGSGVALPNAIQALQSTGFQIGNAADVNANGTTYHYLAFKSSFQGIDVGSYTGNGTDNRNVGGVGFQPTYLVVRGESASAAAHKPASLANANTMAFDGTASYANAIQQLQPAGFQVGTDARVNAGGVVYRHLAMRTRAAVDLQVSAWADNTMPLQGAPVKLWFVVRNSGTDPASGLQLSIPLPVGTAYQSHVATAGTFSSSSGQWSIPALATGGLDTLKVSVQVNVGTQGQSLTTTAAVQLVDQFELDPANDAMSVTLTVGEFVRDTPATLAPSSVFVGDAAAFLIHVDNLRAQSVGLDTTTTLIFSDGVATCQASLANATSIPGNATGFPLLFSTVTVPATLTPLATYDLTLQLRGDVAGGAYVETISTHGRNAVLADRRSVTVTAAPTGTGSVHPGARRHPLLSLNVSSELLAPCALDSLLITGAIAGPGTPAQLDSEIERVRVFDDADADGALSLPDTLLGQGGFSNGRAKVNLAGTWQIPASGTRRLFVCADVDSMRARDGDILDLTVASPADVVFTTPVPVENTFSPSAPLNSPGSASVDGMVATQVKTSSTPVDTLVSGTDLVPVWRFVLPANGYASDVLNALTIGEAAGDFSPSDLADLALCLDDGDGTFDPANDGLIGTMVFAGDRYVLSGLSLPIDGEIALFLVANVSVGAVDGHHFRPSIPINGMQVASGNDGPIDDDVVAAKTMVFASRPRVTVASLPLVASSAAPGERKVAVLHLRLRNLSMSPLDIGTIRLANSTSGPGTADELDREAGTLTLYRDDGNGIANAWDTLLAGGVAFDSLAAVIADAGVSMPSASSLDLLVTADVDSTCARDGDGLRVSIPAAGLDVTPSLAVAANFPLASPSPVLVDGCIAHQLSLVERDDESPIVGRFDVELLGVSMTGDGYSSDVLTALDVVNAGTADATHLEHVWLYEDNGDGVYSGASAGETLLGEFSYSGNRRWSLQGLSRALPPCGSHRAFFVTADIRSPLPGGASVQFGVPINGITVASSNDGPRDAAVMSTHLRVIPQPDRLTLFSAATGDHAVFPGSRHHPSLALVIYNGYTSPVVLAGLRALQSGSALTSEVDSVRIHVDTNGNGVFDVANDATVASLPVTDIYAAFSNLGIVVPAQGTQRIFLDFDIDLVVRDGASVDYQLGTPADVTFSGPVQTVATFPIDSQGIDVVDGMVAAQISVVPAPARGVPPSENDVPGLGFRVPANGTTVDQLLNVTVVNSGTALSGQDIASVRLWTEAGGSSSSFDAGLEEYVADLPWNGNAWSNGAAIARSIPPGGELYYVTFSTAASMHDGKSVQLALPAGAITVGSGNDGPLDQPVTNPFFQTTSVEALAVTMASDRTAYSTGQAIVITMTLRNTGLVALVGVTPSALEITGSGSAILQSGPVPAHVDIGPGQTRTLTWNLVAEGAGALGVCASASAAGGSVTAETACIAQIEIQTPPGSVALALNDQTPAAVNERATDIPIMRAVITRADSPGAAPAVVDELELRLVDDAGAPLPANAVFSSLHVRPASGGVTSLSVEDSSQSTLHIALSPTAGLAPAASVSLSLFADIAAAAAGRAFRIEITTPDAFHVSDANTGLGVGVATVPNLPWQTAVTRVSANAESLLVQGVAAVPRNVNAGQDGISLGSFLLQHPGSSHAAAATVRTITLTFLDANGVIAAPDDVIRRIRLTSGASTVFDSGSTPASAAPYAITLTTPLVITAATTAPLAVLADVRDTPDITRFTVVLDSGASVAAVDANDGDALSVGGVWPLTLANLSIQNAASGLVVAAKSQVPAFVLSGQPNVGLVDLRFQHPDLSASSVRVESISVSFRRGDGTPLPPGNYFDAVSVHRGSTMLAQNTSLSTTSDLVLLSLQIPFDMAPGDVDSVSIRFDTKTGITPAVFRAQIDRDHIIARDINTGASLSTLSGNFPLLSGLATLLLPSSAGQISVTSDAVATLSGDEQNIRVATFRVENGGGSGTTPLDLRALRIETRSRGGDSIDATQLLRSARLFEGDTLVADATVGAGAISFAISPARCRVLPGAPRELQLVVDFNASISGPFRLVVRTAADVDIRDSMSGAAPAVTGSFPLETRVMTVLGTGEAESFTNYPNPFAAGRESTRITFRTTHPSRVTLSVRTLWGAPVRTLLAGAERAAGLHQDIAWDGRNGDGNVVANGVYYLVLDVSGGGGAQTLRRKMAVLR